MSLAGHGWTPGSSLSGLRIWLTQHPETLSWASGLLFRGFPSTKPLSLLGIPCGFPRIRPSSFQSPWSANSTTREVSSPSAFFHPGQRLFDWACLTQPPASSGFGQPPDALIRPELTGPISYRIRSWGLTLQSFFPPGQPYVVSNASYPLDLKITRVFLCSTWLK